jgi:hypothetical protein
LVYGQGGAGELVTANFREFVFFPRTPVNKFRGGVFIVTSSLQLLCSVLDEY